MTETSNLLTRLKGSKRVYLRHMKKMERSILDEIGTFSCENEEQITRLTGLKDGLLEKTDKVKEIDQRIIDILSQDGSEGGGVQSVAGYLRLTLVFVWGSAPREWFGRCVLGLFC